MLSADRPQSWTQFPLIENMKDRPVVENVNRGVFRQLRIDHGSNQLLDIALGFTFAFGEFPHSNFIDFEARI